MANREHHGVATEGRVTRYAVGAPRMIKLLHTADLQLGMPFHKVAGDRGSKLREARLESITRMAALAQREGAELMLIAGDLFDANTVDDRVVVQATTRFRDAALPVFVIPGNHDHCAGPDSVYRRASFVRTRPDNLVVLDDREPRVVLGGRAVLLPAPLFRRHEVTDTTAHFTPDLARDLAPNAVRIGLAHGDVVGFKRDDDGGATNRIDPDRARKADLDYLALGDWHGTKSIDLRTWYSGAPEPTNFKQNDQGNALVVTLSERGAPPIVTSHRVARTRWLVHDAVLHGEADVAHLAAWLGALDAPLETVLKLALSGTLPFTVMDRLESLLAQSDGRLLHLEHDAHAVLPQASDEELSSMASDGFVREAVDTLRAQAAGASAIAGDEANAQARRAALALQVLYRLRAQLDGAS